MAYAIIKIQGKQYRVSAGETLLVDRLKQPAGETINIPEVLLYADGDQIEIGTPYLTGKSVTAKVVSMPRGEKIRVATYKSKSRYRRVIGHRQDLTELSIISLTGKSAPQIKKAPAVKATTTKTKPVPKKSATKPKSAPKKK